MTEVIIDDAIDARKLRDRFVALAAIELAGAEPLETAMQTIATIAAELLPASVGVAVVAARGEAGELELAGSTLGFDISAGALADEAGVVRRVLDGGDVIVVDDLDDGANDGLVPFPTNARSLACFPIRGTDAMLGVLLVLDAEPGAFGPDERVFLDMLARRSAGAMVSGRLIEKSRAAGERSEALAWVANALIGAGDLPDILRAVVEGVAASLMADRVSVVTVDLDEAVVVDQVHGGLGSLEGGSTTYEELMASVAGWVIREGRVAVTSGRSPHPGESSAAHARRIGEGFGPTIVAPLSGSVSGALTVMRGGGAADFGTAEVNLVLAMANQATVGIDNIRLNLATRRTLRVTEALYAFSRTLTLADSLPEVLDAVADGTRDALRAGGVVVYLAANETRAVEASLAGRVPDDLTPAAGSLPALAAEVEAADRPLRRPPIGSTPGLIAAPIRAHHRVVGVIAAIADGEHGDFGVREVDVLVALAAQAGTAVDNVRLFEEVQRLAVTDDLTGIHNRRHLFDLADQEFAQAQRYHRPLAAIMFDLDRFKDVNDLYGHAVGDEVLCEVARRCRRLIRAVDVLGRYGGEEFAVLLPETDLKAVLEIAERFREAVAERPIATSLGPIPVTVSVGVAEIHGDMVDVHELINRADAAMYFAKRTGRNRVEGG